MDSCITMGSVIFLTCPFASVACVDLARKKSHNSRPPSACGRFVADFAWAVIFPAQAECSARIDVAIRAALRQLGRGFFLLDKDVIAMDGEQ